MTRELSRQDKQQLLQIARDTIAREIRGERQLHLDPKTYSSRLQEKGACFVTLTIREELRGCVGSIEPSQPLVLDVQGRSLAAAFEDPRFPPLSEEELVKIEIEISILTPPQKLQFPDPEQLLELLRPGVDGVILSYQFRRATFLPQVWDKLPEPEDFLGRLCQKMGMPADAWRHYPLGVEIYQVEQFTEGEFQS